VYARCVYTTRQGLVRSCNLEWQPQPHARDAREVAVCGSNCVRKVCVYHSPEAEVELRPGVEATCVELHVELQYKATAVHARRVYTTRWRQEWSCNPDFWIKDFRELLAEELRAVYDLSVLLDSW
jgi:hypothetical protein